MNVVLLILCGLFIGFIMLSLGMGAALYIGCFIVLFNLPSKTAAATALVTTLPALVIGTAIYYKQHTIDIHMGNKLLIYAILGTLCGSLIIPYIEKKYYQIIISLILIILSLTIFYKYISHNNHPYKKEPNIINYANHFIIDFASFISGIMVGLAGMSGGGPLVAAMLLLNAPMDTAAATSSYIRIWTTILGIGMHYQVMKIEWLPAFFMIIGTIIGAGLSPIIMNKIGKSKKNKFNKIMKPVIALLLLFLGIKPLI